MNDNESALEECRRVIAAHSKSFALASKLLPAESRDAAVALYAWCRRCDDAIDLAPRDEQPARLARLEAELDAIVAGHPPDDLACRAFAEVFVRFRIPEVYPRELLAGMAMDLRQRTYPNDKDLATYCYRVAGVVGTMMAHVMGVGRDDAIWHACYLGIAMQMTNIARDVAEDWERGRLYLPQNWLVGGAYADPGCRPLSELDAAALAPTVEQLLNHADLYYEYALQGIAALSPRCGLAVLTAALVYRDIGRRVRRQRCDVLAGRAYTATTRKLALVGTAAAKQFLAWTRGRTARKIYPPPTVARLDDVLHRLQRPDPRPIAYTSRKEGGDASAS